THELLGRTSVTIYILHHGASERSAIESSIVAFGDDPADASFIDVATLGPYYVWTSEWPYDRSLESFWTVDFGPYFVLDGTGTLGIMDPRYYPWRVNDDAVPTKLATLEGLTVWRPDLDWEGGNLFSDGQGTCFTTQVHMAENLPQTQEQVETQLFDYFGCEKVIWLHVLHGEGTGHADMFFKPVTPTLVLLGEYDAGADPINAVRLEWNADILADSTNAAGQPFEVRRFPMPSNDDDIWRSYSNGIVVNDLLLVPTYAQDRSQEAEALAIFGEAFPGHTVVPIDSDGIIEWGGAIHCVTRTRPAADHAAIAPSPGALCEGAFRCTTGCGDYDFTGDCWDGLSVYCEGNEVIVELCYYNERCGWDLTDDFMYCVRRGCGSLPTEGECRTSDEGVVAAVLCVDGYPLATRCAGDEVCEVQQDTGRVGCGLPCQDECAGGEGGCEDEGHRWSCGEAGDGDSCLEPVTVACEEGTRCEDASCVAIPEDKPPKKGCGCEAGAGGQALLPLVVVLLLGAMRRRRMARAQKAGLTP
ncbi:MAG: agmatine deiminase family protein, partial [Polyangia bacterium]|nr:agmatine deiminase family protein [Polyangia bacterium]